MIKHQEDYDKSQLAKALWAISQAAFEHGSPWQVPQFLADYQNPASYYLMMEVERVLVGYLIFHRILDEAEVINIAVLPEFKGQGIAQQLLEKGLSELAPETQSVFLEVRESNGSAIALYRKVGFAEIGRRKAYYHQPKEDGLVMRWQADQSK